MKTKMYENGIRLNGVYTDWNIWFDSESIKYYISRTNDGIDSPLEDVFDTKHDALVAFSKTIAVNLIEDMES